MSVESSKVAKYEFSNSPMLEYSDVLKTRGSKNALEISFSSERVD